MPALHAAECCCIHTASRGALQAAEHKYSERLLHVAWKAAAVLTRAWQHTCDGTRPLHAVCLAQQAPRQLDTTHAVLCSTHCS